jgi:hypothetical protein
MSNVDDVRIGQRTRPVEYRVLALLARRPMYGSGPARRYYEITAAGRRTLAAFIEEWGRFRDSVDELFNRTGGNHDHRPSRQRLSRPAQPGHLRARPGRPDRAAAGDPPAHQRRPGGWRGHPRRPDSAGQPEQTAQAAGLPIRTGGRTGGQTADDLGTVFLLVAGALCLPHVG